MTEEWRVHPQFTDYEVSDQGRVRRATAAKGSRIGRVKKLTQGDTGYLIVNIEKKPRKVHVLVLETFVSPRPEGLDGCHRDGDRCNNALANLKWGTRSENMADARAHGTAPRCERHGMAKLTFEQASEIKRLYATGRKQKELAMQFGVTRGHVSYIVNKGWQQ